MIAQHDPAGIVWKGFYLFIAYEQMDEALVVRVWNLMQKEETDIKALFRIREQHNLNIDTTLNLYIQSFNTSLQAYDKEQIIIDYDNICMRYERLQRLQPIQERVPSPSWCTRLR